MSLIEPEGHTIGPDPVAATEEVPQIAPDPEPEAPETPAEETAQETFDREYVEKLRDEAARYRTRARDYESTFGEMPEDMRAGWLELINTANSGDPDAINALGQMLGFTPDVQPAEEPSVLTMEQMREIARSEAQAVWQNGESERQQAQAIDAVGSEAKQLGYDVDSAQYVELLWHANKIDPESLQGETLLQAADKLVKAERQAQWEAFETRKIEEARTSPQAPSGNGVAPAMPQVPKSWAEARDSLHERLSNL